MTKKSSKKYKHSKKKNYQNTKTYTDLKVSDIKKASQIEKDDFIVLKNTKKKNNKVNKSRRILGVIGIILITIIVAIAIFFFRSEKWLFKNFPYTNMDEIKFQLTQPLEGTNSDLVNDFIIKNLVPAVLALGIVPLIFYLMRKFKKGLIIGLVLLLGSLGISYHSYNELMNKLEVKEYVETQKEVSDFIESRYIDPRNVELEFPNKKRNLIYIYLEAMESSYASKDVGGAFDFNLIPELADIAMANEDFSGNDPNIHGARMMAGGTITIAGIFSQTTGLPFLFGAGDMDFKTFWDEIGANNMDTQEHFFPQIVGLGDILEAAGYNQMFMCGSDATFGGRRLYFTEHGNYEFDDYLYAKKIGRIPSDYYVWWGYEDYKLLDAAKENLLNLASKDEPFNFTLLTVDTHAQDGYICDECLNEFDFQYGNAIACSSRHVNELIDWIKQQDFYENTTIVMSGDHQTAARVINEKIDQDYQRGVYTAYINSAVTPENPELKRDFSTLDNFPTTLAALGVKIEGNKLGLGTNVFSSEQTLVEELTFDGFWKELIKPSDFMDKMANFDLNNEDLKIRQGEVMVGDLTITSYQPYNGNLVTMLFNNIRGTHEIADVQVEVMDENNPEGTNPRYSLYWTAWKTYELGVYTNGPNLYDFDKMTIKIYIIDVDGNEYEAFSKTYNMNKIYEEGLQAQYE